MVSIDTSTRVEFQAKFLDSFGAAYYGKVLETFPVTKMKVIGLVGKVKESYFTSKKNHIKPWSHSEVMIERLNTCHARLIRRESKKLSFFPGSFHICIIGP